MCRAGIDLASVEVRFQNLSVDADIAVGARGEPTVLNAYRNKLEVSAPPVPDISTRSAIHTLGGLGAFVLCCINCAVHPQ